VERTSVVHRRRQELASAEGEGARRPEPNGPI
jgi:hypothetical protein